MDDLWILMSLSKVSKAVEEDSVMTNVYITKNWPFERIIWFESYLQCSAG